MSFLLHPSSAESVDTGLDIFSVPPTQTSIETGGYSEYFPLAVLNQSTTIEFDILNKNGSEYLDLSNSYLSVRAKIVKGDGSELDPGTDICAPVNNWIHSLFSQVDCLMNGTLVTPSENTYSYKAFIETLLTYDGECKRSQLSAGMFYKDTAHKMDSIAGNNGMLVRKNRAAGSKEVDMVGRLHCDIMNMNRYIINGVDVKLKLVKSKDDFNIFTTEEGKKYKTVLTHVSLFVKKCTLNPTVYNSHATILNGGATAKYPLKRISVRPYSIPAGSLTSIQDNLFLSQLPNRIIVGLVDSAAYNGNYNKNPFNFKHYDLNFISLYINGNQYPRTPLTPNYAENRFARPFYGLFNQLGLGEKNEGNDIDILEFHGGYTLYVFDLTPSILDGNQIELVKSGTVRLEMKFGKALEEPVHALVYAELDSMIEITKGREIVTDYTA